VLTDGPVSTPALEAYLRAIDAALAPGQVADVGLAARDWCARAALSLARGYLLLVDYGQEACRLFAGGTARGTLRSYAHHQVDPGPRSGLATAPIEATPTHDAADTPAWLLEPGMRDLTAHVDFTTVRRTLEDAGLRTLFQTDQTHWLLGLGLLQRIAGPQPGGSLPALRRRLQAKTLVAPGGPGTTHQVLLAGTPGLPVPDLEGTVLRGSKKSL